MSDILSFLVTDISSGDTSELHTRCNIWSITPFVFVACVAHPMYCQGHYVSDLSVCRCVHAQVKAFSTGLPSTSGSLLYNQDMH